jgi:hypothetical protein
VVAALTIAALVNRLVAKKAERNKPPLVSATWSINPLWGMLAMIRRYERYECLKGAGVGLTIFSLNHASYGGTRNNNPRHEFSSAD